MYHQVITFATYIIAGGEKDGPKPENQLAEESRFSVLEDFHSLQRVQMDVDGNLGFQFVCQFE